MTLQKHVIYTISLTVAGLMVTQSWLFVIGILLGGILIDLDHFLEYWYDCGIKLDVQGLLKFGNSGVNSHQFIIFHSVEMIPILLLLGSITGLELLFYGLIIIFLH